MQRTIAEKILSGKAGEFVERRVDYIMVNDITGVPAFEVFEELKMKPKGRIVVIPDHYVPNKDVPSADLARKLREYAGKYRIRNYYEVGSGGICHQVMMEEGFVAPGRLIVGADSHTTSYGALGALGIGIGSTEAAVAFATGKLWFRVPETQKFVVDGKLRKYVCGKDLALMVLKDIGVDGSLYKSQEWYGSTVKKLSLSERITIANLSAECGAKACIFPPDEKVFRFLHGKTKAKKYRVVYSDEKAEYSEILKYDVSKLTPLVATPPSPANVVPAKEVDEEIDQAYLGSCTNGRIEDLRIAARIMKGKRIHKNVRMIVVPASQRIFLQAMKEGLAGIFVQAGAYFSGPTCGACLGGYMGVLASGERCIASTNRNFIGRMGHPESKVYLASPAVVAASAIKGRICEPP
jgi:3-isopropylmalate/(R)-2-methylmalate dehydratase large subunit